MLKVNYEIGMPGRFSKLVNFFVLLTNFCLKAGISFTIEKNLFIEPGSHKSCVGGVVEVLTSHCHNILLSRRRLNFNLLAASMKSPYISTGITGLGNSRRYFFRAPATQCTLKLLRFTEFISMAVKQKKVEVSI